MGKRSDNPLKTTIALRLPDDVVTKLDALVEHFSSLARVQLTRSDVCRRIMEQAINGEAQKVFGKGSVS